MLLLQYKVHFLNGYKHTMLTIKPLLLISTITTLCLSIQINEKNLNDIKGVAGAKVEVACQVEDLRDPLEDCDFYGPDGTKYSAKNRNRDRNDRRRNRENQERIYVALDDRRDECVLTIDSLRKEDTGPWECVVYDGRDQDSRFVIADVTAKSDKFQLLLDADETRLNVKLGDDVKITCPTNHNSRPVCKFVSPTGKVYQIIGK